MCECELDLCTYLKNAKSGNSESMLYIIKKFEPLLTKYASKLYYLEFEDAKEELIIGLIESIKK